MQKVILASGSPRRKELLEKLGIEFIVEPSGYEEDMGMSMSPKDLAKQLSSGKAKDIAQNYTDALVIGADTLIAFSGKVLGKPHTEDKAIETLKELSGREHSVITGYTIIDTKTGKVVSDAIETKVYFRNLTEEEIKAYVATGEPLDKAGSYAIQGKGVLFVDKIEGDYNNVIGLPLTQIALALKDFGVKVL